MTPRVWKFEIKVQDNWNSIEMPKGAEILHIAAASHETIWMWALVRPRYKALDSTDLIVETRLFQVRGTGHDVPEAEMKGDVPAGKYIGTAPAWPLVWHVWEVYP